MNVFYEEEGNFKVAAVMTENPGSLQVESVSGKRSKIKAANVLLKFEGTLAGFMEQAQAEAETLDVNLLWACCGGEEFGFEALAAEYYGGQPSPVQAAAMAIALHAAPMYFYRRGKGRYKAAPEENLKAALAAQERKRLQAEKVAAYVEELKAHRLPDAFRDQLDALLYAPDKNTLEWKALDQATRETGLSYLKLLEACGGIPSVHDYHLGAFLCEYFPQGTGFAPHAPVTVPEGLPRAAVEAFSIDDSSTTEIDDAFSVHDLPNGNTRIGIHIAAPALGIAPGSELDAVAMQRLSTVYMPGHKITMLPEDALAPYSLREGEWRPALSLYLEVAPDLSIVSTESRIEQVYVAENLRHETLEPYFNEHTLHRHSGHSHWERLLALHQLAESMEKARGKYDPSRPPQVDYSFYVENGKVRIVERRRGSPMDKLVAELMIYTNAYWGGFLAEHGIPGIYRAQAAGKVYMTIRPEPHQGLGVAQYAWCTSPLRRAVDLINQRQVIALLQGTDVPYPAGNATLAEILHAFDLVYNAYGEFQARMERYWCLQYLIQENVQEIAATVWRENLVRLDGMPYFAKVYNLPELATGERVRLGIHRVDPLLMELDVRFLAKLD
ncbi:MAG: RNB domain-containing ribonuclease [Methylophilaceae bacterium]|nr:RNB domain-containing ribonuclease [Methylophilaceae bacterium]